MSQKLQKKIEKKLAQLEKLLTKIAAAQVINSDDPETGDSDTLYNLVEDCKEMLELLEDQKSKQLDDGGEPLILEAGLCSLVDSYQSEADDD